jgi:tetratricopeptide (TPR) repeat protein
MAYIQKGLLFAWGDAIKSLDNLYKAASLHRGDLLPEIYRGISSLYATAGFHEKSMHYLDEAFKLDNDSAEYYEALIYYEDIYGNFEKVLEYCDRSLKMDSTNHGVLIYSGLAHRALGQHKESLESFKELQKRAGAADSLFLPGNSILIGYAYLMNGYNDEAQYYLQQGLEYHTQFIEQGRHVLQNVMEFYALAAGYAVLGDTERALDNLDALTQIDGIPLWVITKTSVDPIFENIWDEPEFKRIMKIIDDNYQAQHERVRQWIEENDRM